MTVNLLWMTKKMSRHRRLQYPAHLVLPRLQGQQPLVSAVDLS